MFYLIMVFATGKLTELQSKLQIFVVSTFLCYGIVLKLSIINYNVFSQRQIVYF